MHAPLLTLSVLLAQAADNLPDVAPEDIDRFQSACGEEPGPICTWVFETSGSVVVSALAGRIIPTLLQIILILVLAYLANRLMRKAIKAFMRRVREEGLAKLETLRGRGPLGATGPLDLARANMRTETIGGVLRSLATFAIWAIAAVMVLDVLGISVGPLIAGAGIVGVALGFGAQSLVKDFLSGIFMLMEDQYGIGDIVDVGEARGTIEAITLRTTRLRDVEGTVWHVPNGQINRVGNMSQQWARSLLDVGVAYDTDVEHAKRVMKRVADDMWRDEEWGDLILDEPDVWGLQDFASDQLTMRIVIKTVPGKQFPVNREYRARLKAAFDEEGIEIPFPQRTVWVRQRDGASGDAAAALVPSARRDGER
ncbi:MAG TPA: mechanosensitive ion channel family protein [Egibacteraceae bacterium]|nr:mechanosensitive ion channel family protein [Egibacteraceae bacterium]